jgi:hypothetical protein
MDKSIRVTAGGRHNKAHLAGAGSPLSRDEANRQSKAEATRTGTGGKAGHQHRQFGATRAKSVPLLTQLSSYSDDNGAVHSLGLDRGMKLGNFRSDGRAVLQKMIMTRHEKAILLRRARERGRKDPAGQQWRLQ